MSKLHELLRLRSYPEVEPANGYPLGIAVGVELEVENFHFENEYPSTLCIEGDGSLRNSGAEIKFAAPAAGADIDKALEDMGHVLEQTESVLSSRTSLHVHLDCSQRTPDEIENLFLTFLLFESFLFSVCGDTRRNNIFCIPLYTSQEFLRPINIFFKRLSGADPISAREAIYSENNKYASINLFNLLYFGSMEVRIHPGTLNPQEIKEWIILLMSIYKRGLEVDVMETCHDISAYGAERVLQGYAGDALPEDMKTKHLIEGARTVQQYFLPQVQSGTAQQFTSWAQKQYAGV